MSFWVESTDSCFLMLIYLFLRILEYIHKGLFLRIGYKESMVKKISCLSTIQYRFVHQCEEKGVDLINE